MGSQNRISPGPAPRPADIELHVDLVEARSYSVLTYRLRIAAQDLLQENAEGQIELASPVSAIEKETLATTQALLRSRRQGGYNKLRSLGLKYFNQLIPETIRSRLHEIAVEANKRGAYRTLSIHGKPIPIPWELLVIHRRNAPAQGTFLCQSFDVARLTGTRKEVQRIQLKRLAFVSNDRKVKHAAAERAALRDLRLLDEVRHFETSSQLEQQLGKSCFDAWHFSTHGDGSTILLDGGRSFDISDLQNHHFEKRPLVFLNQCKSAQGKRGIVGIESLVTAFTSAGAGTVIACQWPVRDCHAKAFSTAFYQAFLSGASLGRAMRVAREKASDPSDPSWLAYAAFGHPCARSASVLIPIEEVTRDPEEGGSSTKSDSDASSAPRKGLDGSSDSDDTVSRPIPPPAIIEPVVAPDPGERVHRDGSVLCKVPRGAYRLGDPDLPRCRRRHKVILSAFWICKTPITNRQYAAFLADQKGRARPLSWREPGLCAPNQPVVGVTFNDCQAYCHWAGLALPTEAQWEAAARGNDLRPFPWGNTVPTSDHAAFGGVRKPPEAVGRRSRGACPFGALDMAGNVWEWCADCWTLSAFENGFPQTDPIVEMSSDIGVLRGGSRESVEQELRTAYRTRCSKIQSSLYLGFRPVMSAEETTP